VRAPDFLDEHTQKAKNCGHRSAGDA